MARKSKRGFGESATMHKAGFQAHDDLRYGIVDSIRATRQFIGDGACESALMYLLSTQGEVGAMGVHANGFRMTSAQRKALDKYREMAQGLRAEFSSKCLCGKR